MGEVQRRSKRKMSDIKQAAAESAKVFSTQAKMMVGGTGVTWWVWLGDNHEAITAVCAIFGAVVALAGLVWAILRDTAVGRE